MKTLPAVLIICVLVSSCSQKAKPVVWQPKMIHIATGSASNVTGDSIKVFSAFESMDMDLGDTKLMVFSLVDSTFYYDFEQMVGDMQAKFSNKHEYIIAVAAKDSQQKFEFFKLFYDACLHGKGNREAYEEALTKMTALNGALDFKSVFFRLDP